MSYSTWTDYGYGICVDDLKSEDISLDRLINLIQLAPELYKGVKDFVTAHCNGQMTISDILSYAIDDIYDEGNFYGGLAAILHGVIEEVEGIDLYVCTDFDGATYLIYLPSYPWQLRRMSEKEQNLTEESLRDIYAKYLHIITDEDIDVDYQSVTNGG